MAATQSLNLYNIALRYFKNEADATAFIKEIEVVVDNKFDVKKDVLATKQDINELRQDIVKQEVKIAESKADMIKWFVAFFITLLLMIIGLYFKK